MKVGLKKLESLGLPVGENSLILGFDALSACDGKTDMLSYALLSTKNIRDWMQTLHGLHADQRPKM